MAFIAWLGRNFVLLLRFTMAGVLLFCVAWPLSKTVTEQLSKDSTVIVPWNLTEPDRDAKNSSQAIKITNQPRLNQVKTTQLSQPDVSRSFYISWVWVYAVQVLGLLVALGIILWAIVALARYD
jgi:hypothetical protein